MGYTRCMYPNRPSRFPIGLYVVLYRAGDTELSELVEQFSLSPLLLDGISSGHWCGVYMYLLEKS